MLSASKKLVFFFFRLCNRKIPPNIYDKVIAKVKETLVSRFEYFSGLVRVLPVHYYTAVDVAWFHRRNPEIVAQYLKQHPDNTVLRKKESDLIKKACDFKEFKFSVYKEFKLLCSELPKTGKNNTFFTTTVVGEAASFFKEYLVEPLKEVADNSALLTTNRPFMDEILSVHSSFMFQNFEDGMSDEAIGYIRDYTEKEITPCLREFLMLLALWRMRMW